LLAAEAGRRRGHLASASLKKEETSNFLNALSHSIFPKNRETSNRLKKVIPLPPARHQCQSKPNAQGEFVKNVQTVPIDQQALAGRQG
jgi:hypothetical protein